jgi:hypothetical protein
MFSSTSLRELPGHTLKLAILRLFGTTNMQISNSGDFKQEICYNTYGQVQSLMHQLMLSKEAALWKSVQLVSQRELQLIVF